MANLHLQIIFFENGISSVMKRERPTDRRTMSNSVLLGLFKTGDDLLSLGIPIVKAIKIPLLCWNIG